METWPNWVDLLIVTFCLRGCYVGFSRGILTELLNLAGLASVTSFTLNYAGVCSAWLLASFPLPVLPTRFVVFWLVFLVLLLAVRLLIRFVGQLAKWERLNWMVQWSGCVLGALRGLWWAGIMVVALASTGFAAAHASVEAHAVLGSRLLPVAASVLEQVADWFPGAQSRGQELFPAIHGTDS